MMIAFTVALISFALVNPDVIRHGGVRGSPGFAIRGGLLFDEIERRNAIDAMRAELGRLEVDGPALVMTGAGPALWVDNPLMERDPDPFWQFLPETVVRRRADPDVHFIDALTASQRDAARSAGYRLYCSSHAAEYLEMKLRFRMADEHIPLVPAP